MMGLILSPFIMIHLIGVAQYLQTHILSIILALVASYVVGFLWHGPIFGKQWMKYNKMMTPKKEDMKFSMMLPGLSANFVLVIVQSAVLGRSFQYLHLTSVSDALIIAALFWLPFTALTIINSYAWEGKKVGHMCLDAAYYLVSLWVISAVLFYML